MCTIPNGAEGTAIRPGIPPKRKPRGERNRGAFAKFDTPITTERIATAATARNRSRLFLQFLALSALRLAEQSPLIEIIP